MQDAASDRTRSFRMSIDIAASAEDVWRALTEAGEIVRWFSTAAEVVPGQGGAMTWSWGEGWDWKTRIDAWEPRRLLRLVQEDARPYDILGRPLPPGEAEPARIAIEFALETHQGRTRLRMVHSGFGSGAAWDDELEGITEGWQAELRSLRHYLERHRGKDRTFEIAWLTTATPRDDAWGRLLGPGGFTLTPAEPAAGERYEVVAPGGERLSGTVVLHLPRQTVAGTARELDDGWFRLLTWSAPGGKTGVWVGLATYGGGRERVRRFRDQSRQALERLFPA